LASALVGWGNQQLQQANQKAVLERLEQARASFHHQHPELNVLLAGVMVDCGFDAYQSKDLRTALTRFEEALAIDASNLRARANAAIVCRDLALEEGQKNNWGASLGHARKGAEYGQTSESLLFLVATVHDYAVYLSQHNQLAEAIKELETVLALPYDHNAINIERLLSALYTDLGANLYNSGHRWEGKQCMQTALQYDSSNNVASRNLAMAGGPTW
jgi:tetratricopeptide (TPR) repeat protein